MSTSERSHRIKWKHAAPKISQKEAGSVSTIKSNKPSKFSPPKQNDASQEQLLLKKEQSFHNTHLKRFNSNLNCSTEARQNLTLLNRSSSLAQALTFIMKEGHIERKVNSSQQNERLRLDGHEHCSCEQLKNTHSLLKQIKQKFLQFREEVLIQLKQYESMVHQEIVKIRQFVEGVASSQRTVEMQQKHIEETYFEANNNLMKMNNELMIIQDKQEIPQIKTFQSLITHVNISAIAQNKMAPIQTKKDQLQIVCSKSSANFQRFFEIMQKMRDTLERKIIPAKQSVLKENSNIRQ